MEKRTLNMFCYRVEAAHDICWLFGNVGYVEELRSYKILILVYVSGLSGSFNESERKEDKSFKG